MSKPIKTLLSIISCHEMTIELFLLDITAIVLRACMCVKDLIWEESQSRVLLKVDILQENTLPNTNG
jgi:hypothetical protein